MRHLGRLYGRRLQNRTAFQSIRQSFLPSGSASGHEKISKLFEEYIARVAPAYVKVRVTPKHGGQGYVCPIDLPAYKAAEEAVAVAFGKRPLAVRRGGSIPIISTFEQVLGIKTVLMGFGLEQNAIHSPNESCTLDFFYKGIESVAEFYKRFN